MNENINVIPQAPMNLLPSHASNGTSEEIIQNVVESAAETVVDSQGV